MTEIKCPVRIEEKSFSFLIVDADGSTIADDGSAWGEYSAQMSHDNARRIVACVNACQGLDTADLEQTGLVSAVGYQLIEVKKQRDALLAALEKALATVQREGHPFRTWHDEAAAAIAAAKGGA